MNDEELTLVPMDPPEEEEMEAELIDLELILAAMVDSNMPVLAGINFLTALNRLISDPEVTENVIVEF